MPGPARYRETQRANALRSGFYGLLELIQRNGLATVQIAIGFVVRGVLGQCLALLLCEIAEHDPVALCRYILQRDEDFRFEQAEKAPATDHQILLLVGIALHHALDITHPLSLAPTRSLSVRAETVICFIGVAG